MRYLLLILEPHGQRAQRTPAEGQAAYERMQGFAETLKNESKLLGVDSLLGDDRGARVQLRNGRPRTMDGPFIESKEMIGGYFLVECSSREEALALAARCPAAEWATVEVRETGPCWA
jgi:hypothetical protein